MSKNIIAQTVETLEMFFKVEDGPENFKRELAFDISGMDEDAYDLLPESIRGWFEEVSEAFSELEESEQDNYVPHDPQGFAEFWESLINVEPEPEPEKPKRQPRKKKDEEAKQEKPKQQPRKKKDVESDDEKTEKPTKAKKSKENDNEVKKPAKVEKPKGIPATQQVRYLMIENFDLTKLQIEEILAEQGVSISSQTVTVVYNNTKAALNCLIEKKAIKNQEGKVIHTLK